MPDRDALGMLYSMEGEHASHVDALKAEAARLRREAEECMSKIAWHQERMQWYREAAAAMETSNS